MELKEYTASYVWNLYETGKDYLNKKNLFTRTNRNWDFFLGRQWNGVKAGGRQLPFLNLIHPNIIRRTTTIYSNRMEVTYVDLEGRTELQPIYDAMQAKFKETWEMGKQDHKMSLMVKEAGITGDGIQFFGYGSDPTKSQRLDCTSLMYGDESEPDIQAQPHIIIHQRETVASVRKQARKNGCDEDTISRIVADSDTNEVIGNKTELEDASKRELGKVITLIFMTKIDGVVHVMRSTKAAVYEEMHPIVGGQSTIDKNRGVKAKGLRLYPIIKFPYELEPNNARGVSQVEQLIPNQIEINKTLYRRSQEVKEHAFNKMIYVEDAIKNVDDLDKVGGKIAVSNMDAGSLENYVTYLRPASISDAPNSLMRDLLDITQDLGGSGETTLGNIDLNRVAATAIVAVNDRQESMHDEQVRGYEQVVEDYANLMMEFYLVYHSDGLKVKMPVLDPVTGNPVLDGNGEEVTKEVKVDQEMLDKIKPGVRIDVTKENSFTVQARDKWLDDLFQAGHINLETRVRLASPGSPIPKNEILKEIQKMKKEQEAMVLPVPPADIPPAPPIE